MSDKAARALQLSKAWLDALIEQCEIEPAECEITVRVKGPDRDDVVAKSSLLHALQLIDEALAESR